MILIYINIYQLSQKVNHSAIPHSSFRADPLLSTQNSIFICFNLRIKYFVFISHHFKTFCDFCAFLRLFEEKIVSRNASAQTPSPSSFHYQKPDHPPIYHNMNKPIPSYFVKAIPQNLQSQPIPTTVLRPLSSNNHNKESLTPETSPIRGNLQQTYPHP
jgi:hypothetical protein